MIELIGIQKSYKTGSFVQKVLNDISVTFRDNEFVAVLGPSGSGKTTMLNIVGGLDRADDGELLINGVSTKTYNHKDWDTYRNHHVGFVFQSYNLIPHQTILSNVELALTLSGVPKAEKKKRASEALARVGLGEHIHKKPNQLSGGQMQRVAIARALVNDPDIVLADEPTGALDVKTGLQIMDLLREISHDRLVIMVTHNPELADNYATRIVSLQDGCIIDDTQPVSAKEHLGDAAAAAGAEPTNTNAGSDTTAVIKASAANTRGGFKKSRKASMSFLTALELSAHNLFTKKGRTILTAFAGSIGIIGIAAILALSNGVNAYIERMQSDAMASYPVSITDRAADFGKLLTTMTRTNDEDKQKDVRSDQVGITSDVSSMFDTVKKNDLASFKTYLESKDSKIKDYTHVIQYHYGAKPKFYQPEKNASTLPLGNLLGSSESSNPLQNMTATYSSGSNTSTDSFYELLSNQKLLDAQYKVVTGRWPKAYNEAVLTLDKNGQISDYTLYSIGVLDPAIFRKLIDNLSKRNAAEIEPVKNINFTYEDALKLRYKVVEQPNLYQFNEATKTWSDMSKDTAYMRKAIENGIEVRVVGVIRPRTSNAAAAIAQGIGYTPALTQKLMQNTSQTEIVKQQLAQPDIDVFTKKSFDELNSSKHKDFDLSKLFSIDQAAMAKAFSFDTSKLAGLAGLAGNAEKLKPKVDFSNLFDGLDLASSFDPSKITYDPEELKKVFPADLIATLMQTAPKPDFSQLSSELGQAQQEQMGQVVFQIARGFVPWWFAQHPGESLTETTDLTQDLQAYLQTPAVQTQLSHLASQAGATLKTNIESFMQTYFTQQFAPYLQNQLKTLAEVAAKNLMQQIGASIQAQMSVVQKGLQETLTKNLTSAMQQAMPSPDALGAMGGMPDLSKAFSFDQKAFANAIHFNMTQEELGDLFSNLAGGKQYDYESNLVKLGYGDLSQPSKIDLYPKDFDAKKQIMNEIDAYNEKLKKEGKEKQAITYSDFTGTLLNSVTNIVNMISLVLIAFVSISLVVSSIMIGIITYISVLERRKEIGILRAMGASRANVANVFNAETFIEGLISGLFAILFVGAVSVPINAVVKHINGIENIMQLAPLSAVLLIIISIVLTVIAGILPARKAAKADPVEALRSE